MPDVRQTIYTLLFALILQSTSSFAQNNTSSCSAFDTEEMFAALRPHTRDLYVEDPSYYALDIFDYQQPRRTLQVANEQGNEIDMGATGSADNLTTYLQKDKASLFKSLPRDCYLVRLREMESSPTGNTIIRQIVVKFFYSDSKANQATKEKALPLN